jgi:hypothetical protein
MADVYVVAESYDIFRRSFLPQFWKYLGKLPEDLRGLANCELVLLGRYWRRKDWDDELLDYCHNHSIEIIKLKDSEEHHA